MAEKERWLAVLLMGAVVVTVAVAADTTGPMPHAIFSHRPNMEITAQEDFGYRRRLCRLQQQLQQGRRRPRHHSLRFQPLAYAGNIPLFERRVVARSKVRVACAPCNGTVHCNFGRQGQGCVGLRMTTSSDDAQDKRKEDDDDEATDRTVGQGFSNAPSNDAESAPFIASSTVRIDDGGSNLTDRFKYKVNALMGVFDPPSNVVDNEQQEGTIYQAFVSFPALFTLVVVGRTNGDGSRQDEYLQQVKNVLQPYAPAQIQAKPRGKKFTRVSAQVMVESATILSTIYKELEALEWTVMRF